MPPMTFQIYSNLAKVHFAGVKQSGLEYSGVATGVYGDKCSPHFCQDGPWDFFKIHEKVFECGIAVHLQRGRGRSQKKLPFMPPLL